VVVLVGVMVLAAYARRLQYGGFTPSEMLQLKTRAVWVALVVVVVALVVASVVVVSVGERMVVYNRVTKGFRTPLTPGYGLVLPVINERFIYDVRTQVYTMSSVPQEGDIQRVDAIQVLSEDGLKMDLDITVQYHLDPEGLNELHSAVGRSYVDKIIRPTVREAIRNEFAKHEATAAYSTEREVIKENLYAYLEAALVDYNMVLEDVLLRNIALPPTVVAAIEDKKAAQQEAERMQYVLEKERQEKERIQIEAEAQAERIRIVNEALANNPNYLHWLAIDKLNDDIELVISDGKTILNLDAIRSD
jgi:regulator of protease activity HflC (stomatin/prohibitin superfamily)